MKIVFFGTPEFAAVALRALIASEHEVVGVVCQPDKPAGRGKKLRPPEVKEVALAAGLPVAQPIKARAPELLEQLRAWAPELIVVAAYGKILPTAILNLPPHGCVNIHGSLLPKYRGAAPIQASVLNGDPVTGVTIMQMTEEMDAGDILLQAETPIARRDTSGTLHDRLAQIGAQALLDAVAAIEAGTLVARPQDIEAVTFAPMIRKEHGRLDWTQPAVVLERRVRAFDPWPSAFTFLAGKRLKILRADTASASATAEPGTIVATDGTIDVATADGLLRLEQVQLEGKKRMTSGEFARGRGLEPGQTLD